MIVSIVVKHVILVIFVIHVILVIAEKLSL